MFSNGYKNFCLYTGKYKKIWDRAIWQFNLCLFCHQMKHFMAILYNGNQQWEHWNYISICQSVLHIYLSVSPITHTISLLAPWISLATSRMKRYEGNEIVSDHGKNNQLTTKNLLLHNIICSTTQPLPKSQRYRGVNWSQSITKEECRW